MVGAKKGDFGGLDSFLTERQMTLLDMSELPDVSELLPDVDLNVPCVREVKRSRGKVKKVT